MKTVLISGGSASGKTTLARALEARVPGSVIVAQDSFYICQSKRAAPAGDEALNFDIPEALELTAMAQAVKSLKTGNATPVPCYDFATHSRMGEEELVPGTGLLIAEGTLVMTEPSLRAAADIGVFVRASEPLRRARREARDIAERGRSPEQVAQQLDTQTFPAHDIFVEPCAKDADVVLDAMDLERDMDAAVTELINMASMTA